MPTKLGIQDYGFCGVVRGLVIWWIYRVRERRKRQESQAIKYPCYTNSYTKVTFLSYSIY